VSHQELWSSAIEAVGVLDCLMALAGAALAADGTMCRPQLLAPTLDAEGRPAGGVFKATQLRHPAGIAGGACGAFVPNDICLGGDAPGFILLTGPNMGGKSTLLRQVCLAAVLAQVSKGAAGRAAGRGPMRLLQGEGFGGMLLSRRLNTKRAIVHTHSCPGVGCAA
jgi:DNA mismatch repair protein MSH6